MDFADPDPIVRAIETARFLGCSRNTLDRWVRQGNFPHPIRLGPRTTGWRRSTIESWLAAREVKGGGQ